MADSSTKPQAKTLSETEAMQQRILALAEMKEKQGHEGREMAQVCKVVQLPLWPEPVRAVPNGFLRSALFGAIKKGARPYLERQEIHAQEGIRIVYTGARLDQGDLDVWETVLHIARLQALGNECRVTAYQLLKALGKTDAGTNRDTLDRRLSRMKATGLDVKIGRYSYEGSLIDEMYRGEDSRAYIIRLNPKLRLLFASDQFTQVEWVVRHALNGKPLAQWLHGFYASHAKPFPLKIETLHQLCGSKAKRMTDYKIDLRRSLDAVVKACEANGELFAYKIENDLVIVERTPSKSQGKRLLQSVTKMSIKAGT